MSLCAISVAGDRGREPGRIGAGGVREAGEERAGDTGVPRVREAGENAKLYLLSFINALQYIKKQEHK